MMMMTMTMTMTMMMMMIIMMMMMIDDWWLMIDDWWWWLMIDDDDWWNKCSRFQNCMKFLLQAPNHQRRHTLFYFLCNPLHSILIRMSWACWEVNFKAGALCPTLFILFPWILASELWICLEGSTCNKRWRASHDDEHRNALCSEDAKCQRTSPCATRCHFPLWNRWTISQCVPAGKCCCLPSQGVLLDSSVLCAKGWREGRPTPSSIKMYQGNTQKQTLMFLVIFWLTQSSLRDDPGLKLSTSATRKAASWKTIIVLPPIRSGLRESPIKVQQRILIILIIQTGSSSTDLGARLAGFGRLVHRFCTALEYPWEHPERCSSRPEEDTVLPVEWMYTIY